MPTLAAWPDQARRNAEEACRRPLTEAEAERALLALLSEQEEQ